MRQFCPLLLIICSVLCHADTMIAVRSVDTDSDPNVQSPNVRRDVYYRRGAMRRKDNLGDDSKPSFSTIANCDTKTGFLIDLAAHQYSTYKVVKFMSMAQFQDYLQKNPGRAVPVESQTIDTGERKTFFGYLARHLITTNRLRDEKAGGGQETIDGWYIDHEGRDGNCAPDYVHSEPYYVVGTGLVMYPDVAQLHHTGPLPAGLAVKLTLCVKTAGTKRGATVRTITIDETVEHLSDAPLSPSLFELPSGFHGNPDLWQSHTGSRK